MNSRSNMEFHAIVVASASATRFKTMPRSKTLIVQNLDTPRHP